jgi:hypothetical protein
LVVKVTNLRRGIITVTLTGLLVSLAGCGFGSIINDPNRPIEGARGSFGVTDVNVHGKNVTCVTWKLGNAGGMSCDFQGAK